MERRLKRITNEINELNKSVNIFEESGIHFHVEDDNINIVYAMMVGPKETPYEGGFYFFKFEYPPEYPMQPPKATYCTQGSISYYSKNIKVRFNPNLYTCGKVCLSMLNTWSGPGWVPTNTISNVLIAIQALVLNEMPLQNEPGFENADKLILNKYNTIIEFANIKIAVIEMLDKIPYQFEAFKPKMNEIFKKNIDFYRNFILTRHCELNSMDIESPAYGMRTILDYDIILNQFDSINIEDSVESESYSEYFSQLKDNILTPAEIQNICFRYTKTEIFKCLDDIIRH